MRLKPSLLVLCMAALGAFLLGGCDTTGIYGGYGTYYGAGSYGVYGGGTYGGYNYYGPEYYVPNRIYGPNYYGPGYTFFSPGYYGGIYFPYGYYARRGVHGHPPRRAYSSGRHNDYGRPRTAYPSPRTSNGFIGNQGRYDRSPQNRPRRETQPRQNLNSDRHPPVSNRHRPPPARSSSHPDRNAGNHGSRKSSGGNDHKEGRGNRVKRGPYGLKYEVKPPPGR